MNTSIANFHTEMGGATSVLVPGSVFIYNVKHAGYLVRSILRMSVAGVG